MTKLKQRQRYSPDVHVTDEGMVEKTYRTKAFPLRIFGALFIFWESFIYSKLNGIDGIPRFLGKPDIYSLHISFMGGKNLRETSRKPDASYYEKLGRIITCMHERDVVHIDMRNRRNYGIDEEGKPYLIDFSPSLYIPWPKTIKKMLTPLDWLGMLKIKGKVSPELLTEKETKSMKFGCFLSSLWLPKKIFNLMKTSFRLLLSALRH
jgi:hypothetical protein